jgi:hypothetical protein
VNQLLLARHLISDTKQSDQTRFQNPFQSEILPAGAEREGRFLELSHPAKERQCEAPLARHDGNRRHHQWLPFSGRARARRPEKPLAQTGPEAAGADAGDVVTLEIAPAAEEPEPTVPADLRKALAAAAPKARKLWSDITPNARRDWIHWITSAKQEETRARRIKNACSMLAAGKRCVCCFDRSGFYSKSLSAPKAAT